MKISELIESKYTDQLSSYPDIEINEIVTDTRKIRDGCLFICLEGSKYDTHNDIDDILSQGAAAVITEKAFSNIDKATPLIHVPSTRRALAYAYSALCGHPAKKLTIVGITGTNGKTSTASFLYRIFIKNGYRTACIGTLGCQIDDTPYLPSESDVLPRLTTMTTPDPDILFPLLAHMVTVGVTHVVMEVSSHALAMEKIFPIRFACGIFTNLTHEHLDYHKDMASYCSAKKKLFSRSDSAVFNIDDACGKTLFENCICPKISCGILEKASVYATDILGLHKQNGISYTLVYHKDKLPISLSCPGSFQVYNSMLAATCALAMGVGASVVQSAIQDVNMIPGRLELVSSPSDDITVYIDYAHTESALQNLLVETAKQAQRRGGKLWVVFGCGGDRDKSKRAPMGACAMTYADHSVITTDNARNENPLNIIADILQGHTNSQTRVVIPDRREAIRHAILRAKKNDYIVIAGKGHESYEIIRDTLFPFDERKIIYDAIKERKSVIL